CLLLLVGCGRVSAITTDADVSGDAPAVCTPATCDDRDPCTMDTCVSNKCQHTPIPPAAGMQTFTASGVIDSFTGPACLSRLTIDASGAAGGNATTNNGVGGKGARIKGNVAVTPGHTLSVLVGKQGVTGDFIGGGGGGSFVWDTSSTALPLIAAGGGGGAG